MSSKIFFESTREVCHSDFQADLTMDLTSTQDFRISFTGREGEVEKLFIYTGRTKWIEHPKFVMPGVIIETLKFFNLTPERYYVTSRERIVLWPVAGLDEEPVIRGIKMTNFEKTIFLLKSRGLLRNKDLIEILKQKKVIEEKRSTLFQHQGKVVVACGGELFIGDTLDEAVKKAREKYKDKPYYSESIGVIEFPSVYEW